MAQQTIGLAFYAYLSGAWVLLDDIRPIQGEWGGDALSRVADTGSMTLQLNNSTGIYSPGGSSALSGWKNGVPFKMEITYDDLDYIKFRGAISDIQINPNISDRKAYITVLDWLDYAGRQPISDIALMEDARADEAITAMLAVMPIQPQSTRIETAVNKYPTIFDSVKEYTNAYSEFSKLANSELGYVYLEKDQASGETLVFEAADSRNGQRTLSIVPTATADAGSLLKEDGFYLLKEDGGKIVLSETATLSVDNSAMDTVISYGENLKNRITVSAYPKKIDTDSVIVYEIERYMYIASGETKTFRAKYTNPNGKNIINALSPVNDSYTKALLHFDGIEGSDAVAYYDETGRLWTTHDVYAINSPAKFGKSAYFDSTAAYLESADSPDWDLGTSDFTIEWWEYRLATTSGQCVTSRAYADTYPAFKLGASDGTNSKVYLSSAGASFDIANGKSFGAITIDTWAHYAITRSGSTFRMFKNGVLVSTWSNSSSLVASSSIMTIGRTGSTYINACIDEFRFVKGYCYYTADFDVPTAPNSIYGTYGTMKSTDLATDLTTYLTVSVNYYTSSAEYTVTNTATQAGYITELKTHAQGVYSHSSIDDIQEDATSIAEFGYKNESIQQAYQQDINAGNIEAKKILERESQPRTVLEKIRLIANKSSTFMMAFLNLDVGDLIHVKENNTGVDAYYYIQGVAFNIQGAGIIDFTWTLQEAYTLAKGLTLMAAEFAGGSATDAVNFGYLPAVSSDLVTKRIISAWIYMDSVPTTHDYVIGGPFSDGGGSLFFVDTHATNRLLSYYHNRYTSPGKWTCPANAFSLSTWTHVLVYHDLSNVNNDPEIYIAGTVQSLTENTTPAGTLVSEEGTDLIIGNWKTSSSSYDNAFDGKIKDFRVYNADGLTASTIAAGIAAEGAGGTGFIDGLVFQAFAVRTRDLTAYTDLTLTDEKVLDAYLGYVGTPNGSPIMRTV